MGYTNYTPLKKSFLFIVDFTVNLQKAVPKMIKIRNFFEECIHVYIHVQKISVSPL